MSRSNPHDPPLRPVDGAPEGEAFVCRAQNTGVGVELKTLRATAVCLARVRVSAPEILLDFNDLKSGFQVGRAAALTEWRARRDDAAFETLVKRLRLAKWDRENPEASEGDPQAAQREARDAGCCVVRVRRWRAPHRAGPATVDARLRLRGARLRGQPGCRLPKLRGPRPRFCSEACESRTKRRAAKLAAGLPVVTRRRRP